MGAGSVPSRSTRLIGPEEAGELYGFSAEFMRRLARERRVRSVKIGKFVRFDLDDLERWIDENRREAAG